MDQSGWKNVEESDESDESGQPEGDPLSEESDRLVDASCDKSKSLTSRTSRARSDGTRGRTSRAAGRTRRATRLAESEESHVSGPIRRDASSDESNFVGATGGDPRVGRVDESNTQPPRRSLVSGPVGATRRTTAERVESTVELCRSDKSTCHYDSTTRVGPRRVASGRAWNWLMSRTPDIWGVIWGSKLAICTGLASRALFLGEHYTVHK